MSFLGGLYGNGSCVGDRQNLLQVEVVDLGVIQPHYQYDTMETSCRTLIRVLVKARSMKERCEEASAGPKIDDVDL